MKRWLAPPLLLLLTVGCATDSPRHTTSGHAPRTLTPDQEIAEPAVRPAFQAADTTQPAPDSVP